MSVDKNKVLELSEKYLLDFDGESTSEIQERLIALVHAAMTILKRNWRYNGVPHAYTLGLDAERLEHNIEQDILKLEKAA